MNKVLVEICIPAIGERFDIFAPVDVPIKELTVVMASGVAELTNGNYIASGLEHLCMAAGLMDPALTLQDYGVKAGMQLYLV